MKYYEKHIKNNKKIIIYSDIYFIIIFFLLMILCAYNTNKRYTVLLSICSIILLLTTGCSLWWWVWEWSGTNQSLVTSGVSVDTFTGGSMSWSKEFVVSVKRFWDFKKQTAIVKQWLINWSQEITVSSQAAGRVSALPIREGRSIWSNQVVVSLSDGIANYRSQLQRARVSLESAVTTYENTRINLDKQVSDLQIALNRAKNDFEVAQETTQQQLKKSAQDLKNADYLLEWTPSNIVYRNAQVSVLNSLDSLNNTYTVQRANVIQNIDTVIQQTDTLLGVTDKYKNLNDVFEIYLWAKAIQTKYDAEKQLLQLYSLKDQVTNLSALSSNSLELKQYTDLLLQSYTSVTTMIDQMILVLRNSVDAGIPSFNQTAINWYVASFQWLKSASQWSFAWLTAFSNSVNNFLSNDSDKWLWSTALLQLESTITNLKVAKQNAEIWYNNTLIATKDSLFKTELGVTTATNNLQNLQRTKQNQLDLLGSSREQAQIALQDAQRQLARLSVTSPIAWTIWSLLVDIWQEVSMGTPLFTISSSINQQVEVYVTKDELSYLRVGQSVVIWSDNKSLSGIIASVSNVADANLNYKAIIMLNRPVSVLWSNVTIYIPISIRYPLVPINAVSPWGNSNATISILRWNIIETKEIKIWATWWNQIEVISWLSISDLIILSSVDMYEPTSSILVPVIIK